MKSSLDQGPRQPAQPLLLLLLGTTMLSTCSLIGMGGPARDSATASPTSSAPGNLLKPSDPTGSRLNQDLAESLEAKIGNPQA